LEIGIATSPTLTGSKRAKDARLDYVSVGDKRENPSKGENTLI